MHQSIRVLRGLQELDATLFRVKDELRRLPLERDRRRGEIDARRRSMSEIDAQARELQTRVKEIEDLSTVSRQRMRKLEGEAANSRGDAALHVAFQHEIKTIKREVGEAEDEGLELVERMEEAKGKRDAINAEIEELEEVFVEFDSNVQRELTDAQERHDDLQGKREERLSGELPASLLAMYNKLVDAREGMALAELQNKVCQGCYISVPPNIYVRIARATEIVQCPSCDRILYLDLGE